MSNGAPLSSLTLLSRTVISGTPAVVDFTFNHTLFDEVFFVLQAVLPVTAGPALGVRTSSNGGASYDSGASDYRSVIGSVEGSGLNTNTGRTDGTEISLTNRSAGNTTTSGGVNGRVGLYGVNISAQQTRIAAQLAHGNSANLLVVTGAAGSRFQLSITNGVRFLWVNGGNFQNGGIISMYGVRNG